MMLPRSLALAATKDDAMSLDEGRHTQRPYRYGMVLLCAGALINWLGLAEDYAEPVRYVGVACIVAGALLICAAMCCWLQAPNRPASGRDNANSPNTHQIDDPIHVINVPSDDEVMQQKPPDYDTVAGAPPTYDDAIKLNPAQLLVATHQPSSSRSIERRVSNSDNGSLQTCQSVSITMVSDVAETIPGQLPSSEEISQPTIQPPKTPPPPYQAVRTIR